MRSREEKHKKQEIYIKEKTFNIIFVVIIYLYLLNILKKGFRGINLINIWLIKLINLQKLYKRISVDQVYHQEC